MHLYSCFNDLSVMSDLHYHDVAEIVVVNNSELRQSIQEVMTKENLERPVEMFKWRTTRYSGISRR